MRDAGDPIDFDALRAHRLIGKFDGVLRDVDGVIADAFEVGRDFQHGRDLAQLAGDGLLAPDQLDAVRLDAAPQIVDDVVAGNDARARRGIAIVRAHRRRRESRRPRARLGGRRRAASPPMPRDTPSELPLVTSRKSRSSMRVAGHFPATERKNLHPLSNHKVGTCHLKIS